MDITVTVSHDSEKFVFEFYVFKHSDNDSFANDLKEAVDEWNEEKEGSIEIDDLDYIVEFEHESGVYSCEVTDIDAFAKLTEIGHIEKGVIPCALAEFQEPDWDDIANSLENGYTFYSDDAAAISAGYELFALKSKAEFIDDGKVLYVMTSAMMEFDEGYLSWD